MDQPDGLIGILHEGCFGNLQFQLLGRQTGVVKDFFDIIQQSGRQKVLAGYIDIHCELELILQLFLPVTQILTGLPGNQLGDGNN
jgi:hypothetical protein